MLDKAERIVANYKIKALKKEGRIRFCGAGGQGKWEVFEEQKGNT